MFVVQFPAETAPTASAAARRRVSPIREEWQPDGTWTGLFDVSADEAAAFLALVDAEGGGRTRWVEVKDETAIGGHRMALYAFDSPME